MSAKDKLLALKSTYLDNESVSNREQLGFAGGIFGNAMGQDSVDTFSDKFNRNFMGISNAMLTVKGNISTVLGFFIPPIAGSLYDLPTRAGKKSNIRKAMLITPIPFGIFSMLLFIVPTKSAMWNFVWALFFHTLFTIVDTFYDIALNALAFKLVSEPADRKKFFTFESISSTLGSMAPGGIIPIIVGLTDDAHKQQWLYFFIALGFCIIGIIAMYAPYFTIAERAPILAEEAKKAEEKITWDKNMISAIIHNRPFMVLQLANMFDCIRQITYKLLPYLYDDTFADYKMKAVIDAISGSLSYVGLLAVPFLGKKFSARAILSGGYFYTAFFYGIMSLFNLKTAVKDGKKQFDIDFMCKFRYPICLCIGFGGIPNAAQGAARKIIVGDSTDYMEWYSEKQYGSAVRSDGLISAANNIMGKAQALIKTNLYNGVFSLIKYKPADLITGEKPVQSIQTRHGIYAAATLCGFLGNFLPAVCFFLDNFKGAKRDEIYKELTEMRLARQTVNNNINENNA